MAALLALAALAVAASSGGVPPAPSQTSGAVPCAQATASTVAADDALATETIYDGESHGREVRADSAHITAATDLAAAVANDDATAALAAVHRIVFTPHWHIVRLRVLSRSGKLLADVGGPYVIAPVTGKVTYRGGVAGSYMMSVQDDVGYAKLVTRFTHLPIELYRNRTPLLGRAWPQSQVPASLPADDTRITVGGVVSRTISFAVKQFPRGTARVVLAIPEPSAALADESCALVSVAARGQIARDIAELFDLPHSFRSSVPVDKEYQLFVSTESSFGPNYIFVRSGPFQIAGTVAAGPTSIPSSGSFVFDARAWNVFSFAPDPPARIYLLFSAPSTGASGLTGASGATQ